MKKFVFFYKTVLIESEGTVTEELCWADLSWSHYFTYQKRVNGLLTECKRLEMNNEDYTGAIIRRRNQMAQLKESQSDTLMIIINGQAIPFSKNNSLNSRPVLIPSKYRMEYYPGLIRDLSIIEKDQISEQQEKELRQKQIEMNEIRKKEEEEYLERKRKEPKDESMILKRFESDDIPEEYKKL